MNEEPTLEEVITESFNSALEAHINSSFQLSEEESRLLEQTLEEAHNDTTSSSVVTEEVTTEHQEIPVNPGSLLVNEATSRFSSAIWYEELQKKSVILAGVGGIGSYVGFLLARMRPKDIFIYDSDIVEVGNLSGQLYCRGDVGRTKVVALTQMMHSYADYYGIFAIQNRYTSDSGAGDIMICGFDNMEARKVFFNNWLRWVESKSKDKRGECLFIDGRLAAEEFQVLCIKGDDEFNINRYKDEFLFSDSEAEETVCSYKQTSFMANMIASVIINLFVNFVANQCSPLIDRDLPFYTAYNAETMYYKTEV